MWSFLARLRKNRSPHVIPSPVAQNNDRETNPVASAKFTGATDSPIAVAAAYEGEAFQHECKEFCDTFRHRPGARLIEYLESNHDERLLSWLDWRSPEPEPKAFIRLMLIMIRSGRDIWDQPGITGTDHGNGVSFDQEAGSAVSCRTVCDAIGAHTHATQHAAKRAENRQAWDVACSATTRLASRRPRLADFAAGSADGFRATPG